MTEEVIRYSRPDGTSVRSTYTRQTPDCVLIDLETQDISFWRVGMATASVTIHRVERVGNYPGLPEAKRLNIFSRAGYGYLVELVDKEHVSELGKVRPNRWYTIKVGPRSDMTRIWVGQNYVRVLREFFVTKDEVKEIVKHFCVSRGGRWDGVDWAERSTIDWKFFIPPEDEGDLPDETLNDR